MKILKDFVALILGLGDEEPVPTIAVWVVVCFLAFIGVVLALADR